MNGAKKMRRPPPHPHEVFMQTFFGVDAGRVEAEALRDLQEHHQRRLQHRALQDMKDHDCENLVEEELTEFMGERFCLRAIGVFGLDYECDMFLCDDSAADFEHNDTSRKNLCLGALLCKAACGFCQGSATTTLALGQDTAVPITTTDAANSPQYHNLAAEEGKTYRVRAWPDFANGIRAMLLIVANPSGRPIRRVLSNSGMPLDSFTSQAFKPLSVAELSEIPRDVDTGCKGDTHIDIVFKAAESGRYKIGVGQATDIARPRSDFDSDAEFSAQARARKALTGEGGTLLDNGWTGAYSLTGAPANGTLKLRVDEVTALPPLPTAEHTAMEDLRSTERGVGIADDIWDPADHPCLWGGNYVAMHTGCCLRDYGR
jgi:hypothetical protein